MTALPARTSSGRRTAPLVALGALVVVLLGGCGARESAAPPPADEPSAEAAPEPVTVAGVGLSTPESIVHDEDADVYLVSNINGGPFDADDNGFISRVAPDGRVLDVRWIDGADADVELHAPKGLAVTRDTLYVTDVTVVRGFDLRTGAPTGAVAVPGATFLNDLAAGPGGELYVSDMAMRAAEGGEGFEPTGTDAVWRISPDGAVTPVAADRALGHPNGVAVAADGQLLVNTFQAPGRVYALEDDGRQRELGTVASGLLDGLVVLPGGDLLVSSNADRTVYRLPAGRPDAEPEAVFADPVSPAADVGYDARRNRLLIPLLTSDGLAFQPLPR